MKPINEKERTLAFVQFLLLFILTIILTVFFVFFDTGVMKTYIRVKKENSIGIENQKKDMENLAFLVDSIRKEINGLNKDDPSFDIKKGNIINSIFPKLALDTIKNNVYFNELKLNIKKMGEDWMVDKNKLGEIGDLKKINRTQERQMNNLSDFLKNNCNVNNDKLELIKGGD